MKKYFFSLKKCTLYNRKQLRPLLQPESPPPPPLNAGDGKRAWDFFRVQLKGGVGKFYEQYFFFNTWRVDGFLLETFSYLPLQGGEDT